MVKWIGWHKGISYVLWTILLMQYVVWFSEYWLDNTEIIVYATLAAVAVSEILIPLHWLVRRLLQFAMLIMIHIVVLDIRFFVPFHTDGSLLRKAAYWLDTMYVNAEPFYPYIWFAAAAWCIQIVVLTQTNSKKACYFVIVLSVTIFAIADSFSYFILWDQVAIIIGCGLLLAVIQHFSEFRQKHPESWQYFKEYPGGITSLVIIIISLTMLAGISAPNVRPLIVDPYTAWKHSRGESVQSFGQGVAGATPNLSQRISLSGYRRDDTVLGGGFLFDHSQVMKVNTNHRSYLRGETRSVYTGTGWEKSSEEQNYIAQEVVSSKELRVDPEPYAPAFETFEIRQTISMASEETRFPVLFGAYAIQQLEAVNGNTGGFPLALWSEENAVLHWVFEEEFYPIIYNIVSQAPVISESELREAALEEEVLEEFADYLQLPEALPERVSQLAREITGGATNQYDQVKAIEQYLKEEFAYSNEPDISKKRSDDFVDSFLFEIQEGYCDYFSTAMVVLSRTLDIPARWVKGFSSGSLVLDEFMMDFMMEEILRSAPDTGGEYTILNSDAHSWVEVYFEGWGWIPFEPTSGFTFPVIYHEEELPAFVSDLSAPEEIISDEPAQRNLIPYAVIIAVVSFFVLVYVFRHRWGDWAALLRKKQLQLPHNAKVINEFNRFLRYANRKGYERAAHETVREMFARWLQKRQWQKDEYYELIRLFERAKYSGAIIAYDEYVAVVHLCKRLREQLK